ncbi:hypothetical protein FJT64_007609 [Amphibalanus amphitrite]|uniref:Uncharacterized protein n=1 Tax=Amphibalanus amphitrite TaxID=1232801 RepID=A0A6A4VZ61_AMPAM|nr:hypothetical protein FJT64_007609 [Amphibalanus amphitrite]
MPPGNSVFFMPQLWATRQGKVCLKSWLVRSLDLHSRKQVCAQMDAAHFLYSSKLSRFICRFCMEYAKQSSVMLTRIRRQRHATTMVLPTMACSPTAPRQPAAFRQPTGFRQPTAFCPPMVARRPTVARRPKVIL